MSQARLPLLSTYLGHVDPATTYWYLSAAPELLALAAGSASSGIAGTADERARPDACRRSSPTAASASASASPHTIAAYRDTFRLLLRLRCSSTTGTPPRQLELARPRRAADRRVPRAPRDRPRQQRRAPATPAWRRSTRSFATRALRHPEHAALDPARAGDPAPNAPSDGSSRSSPEPRSTRCSPPPTATTWTGRRDHALLLARRPDRAARLRADRAAPAPTSHLGTGPHVRCDGKGRKERVTPLTRQTVAVLARLAARATRPAGRPAVPDPHAAGRSAATRSSAASPNTSTTAATHCPSLARQDASRRTSLRHTAAMTPAARRRRHLRRSRSGSATSRIETTQIYLHADLAIKERALARTTPADTPARPLPAARPRSSPSSKACDYAEAPASHPTPWTAVPRAQVGVTACSAIIQPGKQLNPYEEARAVRAMLDRGLTEDGAAQALGWPKAPRDRAREDPRAARARPAADRRRRHPPGRGRPAARDRQGRPRSCWTP